MSAFDKKLNPFYGDLQYVIKDNVNGIVLGTIDSKGRYQIWNPLTEAILRLGSLQTEGDPTNVASEGIVSYGANLQGDAISIPDFSYARIKSGRFGLYNAKDGGYTGYIFKYDVSEDEWYITDNSGNQNIKFVRSTGGLILAGTLQTGAGRISNTSRYTTTQNVLATDENIFCNTDGGSWTLTLLAGVEGTYYKIINCGSSGNTLTIDGNGTEKVMNELTQETSDGDVIDLVYNATEGWW